MTLDKFLSGTKIENINVSVDNKYSYGYVGEDWCIMIDSKGNIDKYIMNNSLDKGAALDEIEFILNAINDKNKNDDIDDSYGQSR